MSLTLDGYDCFNVEMMTVFLASDAWVLGGCFKGMNWPDCYWGA